MRMHVMACLGLVSLACDATGSGPGGGNDATLRGPQGPAGPRGERGPKGPDGPQGPTGPAGDTGDRGYAGGAGSPGVPGADGPQGPQGPRGEDGAPGADGPRGPRGADGAAGVAGPQGPQGFVGVRGPDGADGATGATGPAGPAGEVGPKGATGPTGATGPMGPTGPQGPPGIVIGGDPGPTGPQGDVGPAGAAGPDGAAGVTGPAGALGLACWDLDADGVQDPGEDTNDDASFDTDDCAAEVDFTCVQGQIKAWDGELWSCKPAPFESTDDTWVYHEEFFVPAGASSQMVGTLVPNAVGVLRTTGTPGGGFFTHPRMKLEVGGGVRVGFLPTGLTGASITELAWALEGNARIALTTTVGAWITQCGVDGAASSEFFEAPPSPYFSFAIERFPDHFRFYVNDVEVARRFGCDTPGTASGLLFQSTGPAPIDIDYFTLRAPRTDPLGGPL